MQKMLALPTLARVPPTLRVLSLIIDKGTCYAVNKKDADVLDTFIMINDIFKLLA